MLREQGRQRFQPIRRRFTVIISHRHDIASRVPQPSVTRSGNSSLVEMNVMYAAIQLLDTRAHALQIWIIPLADDEQLPIGPCLRNERLDGVDECRWTNCRYADRELHWRVSFLIHG